MNEVASKAPAVSVVVPAYNTESTLAEAVGSALGGTFRDIEVIIVDDGSSDGTPEVARALVRSDSRVKLLQRNNGGVSAAFNSGIAAATGRYVARLDSDDLWHPAKLERQMKVALSDPRIAFTYTFARYIDEKGRVVRDGPDQRFPSYALCRGIYESLVGANSSALILRSAAIDCGGYDEKLVSWEDLLLQLRISARSSVAFVPEYLVGYRIRSTSLSANLPTMLDSWRKVRHMIRSEFGAVPAFVHRWAHARRCVEFAEAFAWRGNYPMCLKLLAEAASLDWLWTWKLLRHRAFRRLRRRSSPREFVRSGSYFHECWAAERTATAPADSLSSLSLLEAKRIAKLTSLDKQLVAAAPGTPMRPPAGADEGSSPPAPAGP